jgi:hypothetical protein
MPIRGGQFQSEQFTVSHKAEPEKAAGHLKLGHAMVPVLEHRTLTESSKPVENTNLALAGAAFHHQQICTGRVALMRPFLIPAPATGN